MCPSSCAPLVATICSATASSRSGSTCSRCPSAPKGARPWAATAGKRSRVTSSAPRVGGIRTADKKTWTSTASTSRCCTPPTCCTGSKTPSCSRRCVAPITTGSTTTAPANPDRLVGVAVVPLQDPVLAIRELQRCVNELGCKGVMVRPAPYIGTHKLYHPVYDVFWKECTELDIAVGVHPLPYSDMPNVTRGLRLDEGMMWTTQGLFLRQALANAIDMQVALAWFVGGGICERFPTLRVGILEGSGGWVPTMLERLDHHFHIYGSEHQSTLPSELFGRQCWVSFDPDEVALAVYGAARRRRSHPLGVRLPASRREDPRRGERAARSDRWARRRGAGADPRRQRAGVLPALTRRRGGHASRCRASLEGRTTPPRRRRPRVTGRAR